MLLPSYFLTSQNFSKIAPENYLSAAGDEDSIKEILNLPKEIDTKLKFFQSNINGIPSADFLSKVINFLPEKVALNTISFSRNKSYKSKNGVVILVSGTALDRDSLVSFSTLLKESNLFSAVEVPVSSLTKDKNLPFSMNIFIEVKK